MGRNNEYSSGPGSDAPHPGSRENPSHPFDVLDSSHLANELRDLDSLSHQILSILVKNPGFSLKELAETIHSSVSETQASLLKLKESGIVEIDSNNRVQRFYPIVVPEPIIKSWLRTTMKNVDHFSVIDFIVEKSEEKLSVNKVANSVNASHSCVVRLLKELEFHGLVSVVRTSERLHVETLPGLVQYWSEIRDHRKRH